MPYLWLCLVLGLIAGLANLAGGAIVTARAWSRPFLAYFIALGSGFMLATAITQMVPESLELAPRRAALLILAGYFIVHIAEHAWPAHFHFGEETHVDQFLNPRVAYLALVGLTIHTFFDGVSIVAGFLISNWLGAVIFGAVVLHNVPEGFTMASIMAAARKSRAAGLCAVGALGLSRIAGILAMVLARRAAADGLALSAGVTLYVAASDLIPEVNRRPGLKTTLAIALGVALVVFLRLLFFGSLGS